MLPNQANRLSHAIEVLMTLDREEYPHLYKVLNGGNSTMGAKLMYTLNAMKDQLNIENQWAVYLTKIGKVYHALSVRYLVSLHGGSNSTWQNMRAFACDAGLLSRIKPGELSKVRPFQISNELGERYGKTRGVGWYSVPEYSTVTLKHAESVAMRYLNKGFKPSKISKKMVADASGQAQANRLYADGRKKGTIHRRIEHELSMRIQKTIAVNGYATKKDVIAMAVSTGYPRKRVEQVWAEYGGVIIKQCGAEYRRPSTADKQRFGLADNCWILLPINNE